MENATKALLIAAAILVAIVIISIGMVVLRQGQETTQNAGSAMSEAEKTQFNSTFTNYCGTNVDGSQLYALLKKIKASNEDENESKNGRYVQLKVGSTTYGGDGAYTEINLENVSFPKSTYYKVEVTKEYNSGIVKQITATERTR